MSYTFTLGNITWGTPAPTDNVTCTVKHRMCPVAESNPIWIVDSANVVVQPNGILAAPLVITGLDDGQCYEFQISPNCGSAPKIKMIVIPATGGVLLVTLYNNLPAAPISQFRISGNNMLSGALTSGDDVDMDVTAILDGTAKAIAILLPGSETAKWFHFKLIRGANTLIDEGYFQATGGYDTIAAEILQHTDKFYVRQANEHVNIDNYGDGGVTIVGTCDGTLTLIRTALAQADAAATGETVRVNFTATGDNGCNVTLDVDFNPGDLTVGFIGLSLSCIGTPCANIAIVINSVTVLP